MPASKILMVSSRKFSKIVSLICSRTFENFLLKFEFFVKNFHDFSPVKLDFTPL